MRLLSRRDHSVFELKQKLAQRQYEMHDIDAIVDYCIENDWLNDSRFASALLRQGIAKGYGLQRIFYDAKRKGIALELIESAEAKEQCDWYELAKELVIKRYTKLLNTDYKLRAKCSRYLQNRGFNFDQIQYALFSAYNTDSHK